MMKVFWTFLLCSPAVGLLSSPPRRAARTRRSADAVDAPSSGGVAAGDDAAAPRDDAVASSTADWLAAQGIAAPGASVEQVRAARAAAAGEKKKKKKKAKNTLAAPSAAARSRWGDAAEIGAKPMTGGWAAHTRRGSSARAQAIVDRDSGAGVVALRLSHVLLASEPMADEVLATARAGVLDFAELAAQITTCDITREDGGAIRDSGANPHAP